MTQLSKLRSQKIKKEEKDDPEYIDTNPPSPHDPSISLITEKVRKLNSFLESLNLVPPSSNTQFVCTKENDGDIMFVEIIKKYDDSSEEELEEDGSAVTGELGVEYFDRFPTRSEIAYHKTLIILSLLEDRVSLVASAASDSNDEPYGLLDTSDYFGGSNTDSNPEELSEEEPSEDAPTDASSGPSRRIHRSPLLAAPTLTELALAALALPSIPIDLLPPRKRFGAIERIETAKREIESLRARLAGAEIQIDAHQREEIGKDIREVGSVFEGMSRSVLEGVSRSVPEGMSRSVPEGMSRSVLEGMSRSVPEGMSRSVPEGMSRSVPS
ncbi:hypothetical protein Tco_0646694 [Tanacetum coccineum]